MPEVRTTERAFCMVLHDIAPSTWDTVAPFIDALDARGRIPLTFLVVPNFHHLGSIDRAPRFLAAIERRLKLGDEVVLHGYYHDDAGPLSASPRDWFMRRIYTHEAEFYRLTEMEALDRLHRGVELFAQLGWPVRGFVAPAWLLGDGSRKALTRCDFAYTSNAHELIRLPEQARLSAPSLVWSAHSGWRRAASRVWNIHLLARHAQARVLRLGVHPVDLRHRAARQFWLDTVQTLGSLRTPLTKFACLGVAA
jgi:predicted deacetylase